MTVCSRAVFVAALLLLSLWPLSVDARVVRFIIEQKRPSSRGRASASRSSRSAGLESEASAELNRFSENGQFSYNS